MTSPSETVRLARSLCGGVLYVHQVEHPLCTAVGIEGMGHGVQAVRGDELDRCDHICNAKTYRMVSK